MASRERYRQVATLHFDSIDQGFLATLGIPFLSLMYQAIDRGPDSVLLVEEAQGRVRGFVSAGSGMGPIYRRMLLRPFSLAWTLLPSLVRPARFCRILEILRYGQQAPPVGLSLPVAELLSIAVDPSSRGTGVSEALYRRLVSAFAARGVSAFRITVGDSLGPAHRFYTRMGAKVVTHTEVHAGQGSVVYVHVIDAG